MKKYLLLFFVILSLNGFSQTTILDFTNSCSVPQNSCNTFRDGVFICGNNIEMKPTHGSPAYENWSGRPFLVLRALQDKSEGFYIKYSFEQGVEYTVKVDGVSHWNADGSIFINAYISNGLVSKNDGCGLGTEPNPDNNNHQFIGRDLLNTASVKTYTYTFTPGKAFNFLWIWSSNVHGKEYASVLNKITITKNIPQLIVSAGSNKTITCGGNVQIGGSPSASGGIPPYIYSWSPSTGLSATNIANPTASPAITTTYTLTVTDTQGQKATSSTTVNVTQPTISISGPRLICDNASRPYTLSSLPAGYEVSWSVPRNLRIESGGSSQTAYIGRGLLTSSLPSTITASITDPCGGPVITATFVVLAGNPTIVFQPGNGSCSANPYYEVPYLPGVTYTWSETNPHGWLSSNGTHQTAMLSTHQAYFNMSVTITEGSCSLTNTLYNTYTEATYCNCFYDPSCSNQGIQTLSVYPNPGNTYVEISSEELTDNKDKKKYKVEIYDHLGNKLSESYIKKDKDRIDVTSLKEGNYILHFHGNKKVIKKQIVIKRN